MSLREQLRANRLRRERVPTPEWESCPEVWVRVLTGTERCQYEEDLSASRGATRESRSQDVMLRLLVRSLCDERGERLLADEDAEPLGELDSTALMRCFETAARLNALTAATQEELEKNSGAPPGSASGSSSPAPSATAPSASSSNGRTPES
jgi:hypothetical protein